VKLLSNLTYSLSHRQAGTRVMNIQSILCKAPDLCKNVSVAVLIGRSGNLYKISTPSDICVYLLLLILQSFGWLAAFRLELFQAILFIAV
jgi:hypothetical protein